MVLVGLHSVIDLYGALLAFQLKAARPTCLLRQAGVRCQHAAQLVQKPGFNATKKIEDIRGAKHPATLSVDAQLRINNQLWCYTMLLYYDLVKYIRPDGAERVGKLIRQEIIAFLGLVLIETSINTSAALKNLNN